MRPGKVTCTGPLMQSELVCKAEKMLKRERVFEHDFWPLEETNLWPRKMRNFFLDEFVRTVEKASKTRCPKNHIIKDRHYVRLSDSQIKTIEKSKLNEENRS